MKNFIWTECLGCSEIGIIAIKSFLKYHNNLKLNVFIYEADLGKLPQDENIIYHTFEKKNNIKYFISKFSNNFKNCFSLTENLLKSYFKKGHKGTAHLWSYILKKYTSYDNYIHFDSDVVFCDSAINDLIKYSYDYDIVGQCRPYKCNPFNINFGNLPDLVATCCFLFKPALCPSIKRLNQKNLAMAIQGRNRITGKKLIDFFDQIALEIFINNGKIKYLSVDDFGGTAINGSRKSSFSSLNNMKTKYKIDVGRKMVHFSAVGSGYNIWKTKATSGSKDYDKYALDRFYLYMKCFYPDSKIKFPNLDKYSELIDYFNTKNF